MTYFSEHISSFLNNLQNPSNRLKDIKQCIDYIYPLIASGKVLFPDMSDNFSFILSGLNVNQYKIESTLSNRTVINGETIKTGYNPLTILTLLSNVSLERLLTEISDEQNQTYILLKQIFNQSHKDLFLFKCLGHIYTDISKNIYLNPLNFNEQDESLCYIYKRDPYYNINYIHKQGEESNVWIIESNLTLNSNTSLNLVCYDSENNDIASKIISVDRSDLNSIKIYFNNSYSGECYLSRDIQVLPFIYSYVTLFRIYNSSSNYYRDILNDDEFFRVLGFDLLSNELDTYIHSNFFIKELVNFCFKNIFFFSGKISTNMTNEVTSAVSNIIGQIKDIFIDLSETEQLNTNITSFLVYDCTDQISHYSALKVTHELFYDQIETFFNIPNGLNWYKQEEEIVKKYISDYLKSNIELLRMMENISFQFKDSPLFFINSFIVIHAKYAQNLISSIGTGFEIGSWRNNFSFKPEKVDELKSFLEQNYLQYNEELLRFHIFIRLRTLIYQFLDHDSFKSWIIDVFFPTIISVINTNYLSRIETYKHVDSVIYFFKLIFMKAILDGDLFNNYSDEFIFRFNSYLNSSTFNTQKTDIVYLIDKLLDDLTATNLLNSFFKGSVLSKYIESALLPYAL